MPEQPLLTNEQTEIKKRAVRRVIVASVLVAAAIAALTVLTRYKFEPAVTQTTQQGTVLPPVTQAEPAPVAPEETIAPTIAPPAVEEPPAATPPPPEVVNTPLQATLAGAAPKSSKPATGRTGAEVESSSRPVPAKPAATPPVASPRATQELLPAPATKSVIEKAPASTPTPALAPAKLAEPPPKAYTVQLGFFSNPTNAQQLQEKLTQNGIKSYTETKLNVGPFQNKAEAEQALAKIRAMGISAVVVPVR